MAQYLLKYKGKYRILPELCMDTNDFPRNKNGDIEPDSEIYIACQNGNKIEYYGLNKSRRGILIAYIPSLQRGRNIKKELKKLGIEIIDYDESATEVMFKFLASDIEPVAELMKAKTQGANVSPFSSRNIPKNKDAVIPDDDMAKYKNVISRIDKADALIIRSMNKEFMDDVLAKKLRPKGKRKPYDYKSDMRKLRLTRQMKEYIWVKGLFQDYIDFLDKKITEYYSNK